MAGIVVEGPDGAGKTTLVRELRNKLQWPVVHVVQPKYPNVKQMLDLIRCSPIIFDRFHMSPVIYGRVLRDGPELSAYDLWAIEGSLKAHSYINVVCVADAETMAKNNAKAPQLWEAVRDIDVTRELGEEYRHFESLIPTFTYNYEEGANVKTVLQLLTPVPALRSDMLGTVRPFVWLVGDERKDKGAKGITIPFYDEHVSHKLVSGTLMYRAFKDAGLHWNEVALTNSEGIDLAQLHIDLGWPTNVVALGNVASLRLEKAGIEHEKIPHPQYWRRFHYGNPAGYSALLKEAVDG